MAVPWRSVRLRQPTAQLARGPPGFVPMLQSRSLLFKHRGPHCHCATGGRAHVKHSASVGSHPRSMPCLLQEHTHGTPDSHTRNHSIEARGRDPDEFAGEQAITPRVCRCRRDSRLGTRPRGQSSLHPWLPWPLPYRAPSASRARATSPATKAVAATILTAMAPAPRDLATHFSPLTLYWKGPRLAGFTRAAAHTRP